MDLIEIDLDEDARWAGQGDLATVEASMLMAFFEKVKNPIPQSGPPTIGVLSGPKVAHTLWRTLGGKVEVQHFLRGSEVGFCDLLFIATSWLGDLDCLLRRLDGSPMLTVGRLEGFCASGGMIELYLERGEGFARWRFHVNPAPASRSGVDVRKLLPFATTIYKE